MYEICLQRINVWDLHLPAKGKCMGFACKRSMYDYEVCLQFPKGQCMRFACKGWLYEVCLQWVNIWSNTETVPGTNSKIRDSVEVRFQHFWVTKHLVTKCIHTCQHNFDVCCCHPFLCTKKIQCIYWNWSVCAQTKYNVTIETEVSCAQQLTSGNSVGGIL